MKPPVRSGAAPNLAGTLTMRERVARRAGGILAFVPNATPHAGGVWASAWPLPALIFSAFMIAWGAECAQFMVSRGMALAILAWLQAAPEFAVEAVIAWSQQVHYMTANFTGSLRLLVGLGWPLIFGVAAFGHWRRQGGLLRRINLEDENCVEVISLGLPILYFLYIHGKGTLTLIDAGVLLGIYILYLWVLKKLPPRDMEHVEDLEWVPRKIMGMGLVARRWAVVGLFLGGGLILYLSAEPFLRSMLHFAVYFGVTEYLFIQWVAPFLSEFPEKVSAIYWARQRAKAPMALLNMVSANINQWTMLAAMIPIVYSMSIGAPTPVVFDDFQKKEILLTISQSLLGLLLLSNMSFHVFEAAGIFCLWALQLVRPHLHEEVTILYLAWTSYEVFMTLFVRRKVQALIAFIALWKKHGVRRPARSG